MLIEIIDIHGFITNIQYTEPSSVLFSELVGSTLCYLTDMRKRLAVSSLRGLPRALTNMGAIVNRG